MSGSIPKSTRRQFCTLLAGAPFLFRSAAASAPLRDSVAWSDDLASAFLNPPAAARPHVLWMWMGSNLSKDGITRDLEAMQEAGIGGATIYSLADTLIPWAAFIRKSPTPEIITYSDPWWELLRHAAREADRLGLELILFNCAGYESSGGTWITTELSMKQLVWSEQNVAGGTRFAGSVRRPVVDPHPQTPFPQLYIPALGRVSVPEVEARNSYFKDIALFAVPRTGVVSPEQVIDLSSKMTSDGAIVWDVPDGDWTLYRFGYTTTGALIQPAQWEATGLECDKMSTEAVTFHMQHVLTELKKHLGDLIGKSVTSIYFDSYEAGKPTWTGKMREEFQSRRGYDLLPWLPVLAGRIVRSDAETERVQQDFKQTVHDLFRDSYWATLKRESHAAGLKFVAEPYEGPWEIAEVVPDLDISMVEFWTTGGRFSPSNLEPVVAAAHQAQQRIIAAESFSSAPDVARWSAHPAWLKPIGDAAFCAGVNRMSLHHFVQQPWDDRYRPGNTMGQWGIHFGRYQTWWKPGKAWITYLWRCQVLLQSGTFVPDSDRESFEVKSATPSLELKSIHRKTDGADLFFVANLAWQDGSAVCAFPVKGRQPELWDPVRGSIRILADFEERDGFTHIPFRFAATESFFIVFRRPISTRNRKAKNFPVAEELFTVDGPWAVSFDPAWGGPAEINFNSLEDWTERLEKGIRYYSGTARYRKGVTIAAIAHGQRVHLDLGTVHHLAEITLNGKNLGVVWTAPWRIDITEAVVPGENLLEIACTNVWANRLIGDEQEPPDMFWEKADPIMNGGYYLREFPDWFLKNETRPSRGRYGFTTWNYFNKDSKLQPSGLLGPVRILTSHD